MRLTSGSIGEAVYGIIDGVEDGLVADRFHHSGTPPSSTIDACTRARTSGVP